ncbi:MerR family transcriptional regulator [Embleya hyalina]|uniref:MerR family transcriptional regulator n=1 Tax=Embleya hyalina TaxID=516124 RepID=A0A401YK83_9ACTN|nr:MerR family transcriptional regulator [Embleya hyalina]GCD95006.1 MerR family transcriptional regulator [Embleya hyalina]
MTQNPDNSPADHRPAEHAGDDAPDPPGDLSIGEVAARTGLTIDTLRFYEREGILANPVRRGPGGRRRYAEHDIAWLNMCIVLRGSGMPIPAIRHYTELARAGEGTERERLAILREHKTRIAGQIAQLHQCMDLIGYKIGVYEDYLADAEPETDPEPEPERGLERGLDAGDDTASNDAESAIDAIL